MDYPPPPSINRNYQEPANKRIKNQKEVMRDITPKLVPPRECPCLERFNLNLCYDIFSCSRDAEGRQAS